MHFVTPLLKSKYKVEYWWSEWPTWRAFGWSWYLGCIGVIDSSKSRGEDASRNSRSQYQETHVLGECGTNKKYTNTYSFMEAWNALGNITKNIYRGLKVENAIHRSIIIENTGIIHNGTIHIGNHYLYKLQILFIF